jgi:hypothetical protein
MVGGRVMDLPSSEYGELAGCCECGNEILGSVKCREILIFMSDCRLPKKNLSVELVGWLVGLLVRYLVN